MVRRQKPTAQGAILSNHCDARTYTTLDAMNRAVATIAQPPASQPVIENRVQFKRRWPLHRRRPRRHGRRAAPCHRAPQLALVHPPIKTLRRNRTAPRVNPSNSKRCRVAR